MQKDYFIHESSILDVPTQIGKDTKIWHFSHIMKNVKIGEKCVIGQNVFIASDVEIGNGVKVQNNVSLYKGVYCEDDVFIGPSVVFTNVINPRSFIERKEEFKPTSIKKGATIGANSTIICGVTIGKYAMIGAGSVVTKNIPDFALFVGNPAKQIAWISKNGTKLAFDNDGIAICEETKQRYILESNNLVRRLE